MLNFSIFLKKIPHIFLLSRLSQNLGIDVWLVGGVLRDIYLGKIDKLTDFDFCVQKNTTLLAKKFALSIAAKFIVLDKNQESLRVILKHKGKTYTYDFTRMRGSNIIQDLSSRDFSINTLAVKLENKNLKLMDNFRALKDLKSEVIRIVKPKVIVEDPLRILRGFAFMANYGFRIEDKTLRVMVKSKGLIKKSSPERINEELFKIFKSRYSYKTIKLMSETKMIDEIIAGISKMRNVYQGSFHHLDVWEHSIETLKQFELLYSRNLSKKKELVSYLEEELAQNRKRIQILKLACLLHDIGKPLAKARLKKKTIFHTHEKIGRDLANDISDELRISLKEKEVLKQMIFWHLRPGYLADQIKPTRRAIYRFFRDTQKEGVGIIILSLSDWRATRGPETSEKKRKKHERIMLSLITKYFREQKRKPLPRLVDGYNIMKRFHLAPGPLIGVILQKIAEEQALGEISTIKEAYNLAKKVISQQKKAKV
ncbi:MAG: CCA tRNA nucleotidyltransferase [Candidatus Omnitrophica bacterium]|jgi:tRNA nucleotidyltransferase/poly(A) polymerase|nr:CCA tRNA nucleotidyltransferase [Candidatus Omnitrophota bacterium]